VIFEFSKKVSVCYVIDCIMFSMIVVDSKNNFLSSRIRKIMIDNIMTQSGTSYWSFYVFLSIEFKKWRSVVIEDGCGSSCEEDNFKGYLSAKVHNQSSTYPLGLAIYLSVYHYLSIDFVFFLSNRIIILLLSYSNNMVILSISGFHLCDISLRLVLKLLLHSWTDWTMYN